MAINLLPKGIQKERKLKRTQSLANIVSISLLVILATATVVLFSYRTFITRELKDVDFDLDERVKQVEKFKVVEGRLKAIHLKLDAIKEVFANRYPYGEILENLDRISGGAIYLSNIEVKKANQFTIDGRTDSLESLATYVKSISEAYEEYKDVTVDSIKFIGDDYRYQFALNFLYENQEN